MKQEHGSNSNWNSNSFLLHCIQQSFAMLQQQSIDQQLDQIQYADILIAAFPATDNDVKIRGQTRDDAVDQIKPAEHSSTSIH